MTTSEKLFAKVLTILNEIPQDLSKNTTKKIAKNSSEPVVVIIQLSEIDFTYNCGISHLSHFIK